MLYHYIQLIRIRVRKLPFTGYGFLVLAYVRHFVYLNGISVINWENACQIPGCRQGYKLENHFIFLLLAFDLLP